QQVIDTNGKLILDVGCGTGYMALALAEANPGAKIVGIDLSEASIDLARKRLQYHGFVDSEFHTLSIEDLPSLGLQFDYINCDETLYLLPDLNAALQAMKSVLKPNGIIRGNLHSAIQRQPYYRAQKLFRMLGLMEGQPGDMEAEIAIATVKSLKENIDLRAKTWDLDVSKAPEVKSEALMNYLLQGDKGFTIPEMFAALDAADLEFLSMVNWRQWDLLDLFKEPDNLPVFWQLSFSEVPLRERLQLFELIHSQHRLLDFWCTHSSEPVEMRSVADWEDADWDRAIVQIHPILSSEPIKSELLSTVAQYKPLRSLNMCRLRRDRSLKLRPIRRPACCRFGRLLKHSRRLLSGGSRFSLSTPSL
ncbi:MAG: class I SAM-dependent methyltransferase, partial [Leptolyngbyaceae cyanobacterium SU_3_3]|nr:class I SAM-dependent methyltransferase [Leptolyngbyaceae cyanobacterium SU_3_3]